jgi:hypothetical protein
LSIFRAVSLTLLSMRGWSIASGLRRKYEMTEFEDNILGNYLDPGIVN